MLRDFGTEAPGESGMPNQLSMASIQSIETLHRSGHSNREIARILGIDRGAVNKYVRRLRTAEAPPAMPEAGSEGSQNQPNPHIPQTVSQTPGNCPGFPGRTGSKSLCEQYGEMIAVKFDQGLSAVRIHLDLRSEHSFPGSYHSVRRFIEQLGVKKPPPFRRMEVNPEHEAQIDLGTAILLTLNLPILAAMNVLFSISAASLRVDPEYEIFEAFINHHNQKIRLDTLDVRWRNMLTDPAACLLNLKDQIRS